MVNGSQCKISGAVGHAWGYAHAQWADDHVAALHVRGGLRMRGKRTTAWQLLTRSQIAIDRVSLLLVPTHPSRTPLGGGGTSRYSHYASFG